MVDQETAATLFRDVRGRVIDLAGRLDGTQLASTVPACPKWTIRDLLAHLAGGTADVVGGNLDGAPGDAWTAAHVAARSARGVPELLEELAELGPRWEEIARRGEHPNFIVRNPFLDSGVHEADLHAALGLPRPPEEVSRAIADTVLPRLAGKFADAGTFTVITPEREFRLGTGEETATVMVDAYELSRALFGRRSRAQIEAWEWTGAPGPFAERVSVMPQTRHDLVD